MDAVHARETPLTCKRVHDQCQTTATSLVAIFRTRVVVGEREEDKKSSGDGLATERGNDMTIA